MLVLRRQLRRLTADAGVTTELMRYFRTQKPPLRGLGAALFYGVCVGAYLDRFRRHPERTAAPLDTLLSYKEAFSAFYALDDDVPRSTRDLEEGRKVHLFFSHPGRLTLEIEKNHARYLVVSSSPDEYPYGMFRLRGLRMQIAFEKQGEARYIFSSTLRREVYRKDKVLLYLVHTSKLDVIQRREHPRVGVDTTATVRFFSSMQTFQDGLHVVECPCTMRNISVGGACLLFSGTSVPGPFLKINLAEEQISFSARIKRTAARDADTLQIHVAMEELDPVARVRIKLLVHGLSLSVGKDKR